MNRVLNTIAAAAITIWFAAPAHASESTPLGTIEVNGQGEITVAPDQFRFAITIDSQTTKGRVTVAQAQQQMVAALEELGIDSDSALRLNDLAATSQRRGNTPRTSAQYELTVSDPEQARGVIPALNTLNTSRVDLTSTSHSQMASYRSQARILAVEDAMTKASELSAALGRGAVEFASLKEYTNYNEYHQPLLMRNQAAVGDQTQIEFNDIKIQCNVDARFLSLPADKK